MKKYLPSPREAICIGLGIWSMFCLARDWVQYTQYIIIPAIEQVQSK